MTNFVQFLNDKDKAEALLSATQSLRSGQKDPRVFDVAPQSFRDVPGAPFSYWVSDKVRSCFLTYPALEHGNRTAQHGGSTKDDFRFIRVWWEPSYAEAQRWLNFAKGGAYSLFYADVYLVVNWLDDARELEAALLHKYPYLGETANWVLHRECNYGKPGLTWPSRTLSGLGMRVLPSGCVFSSKGPAAFVNNGDSIQLLVLLAITISTPFRYLVSLQMASVSYEVGVIQRTPIPEIDTAEQGLLAELARTAWSLKRNLDTTEETSHAFHLPALFSAHLGGVDSSAIDAKLDRILKEIDEIAFGLYGFDEIDRISMGQSAAVFVEGSDQDEDEEDKSEIEVPADSQSGLLSWCVGVAFSRFDWRLATGERKAPPDPDPFDPLPAKSPGMLPDDAEPFHDHAGILVDDQGHPHDLAHLIEEVLERVGMSAPNDVRRWLQRDFFSFHLQRYSKSRRKAPIYWPLATASGSYTLWLYYPSLSSQTLYTAINDFVEPKLKEVGTGGAALRNKGTARTRDEEKQFETLQAFELELIELRDTLLRIAQGYQPNHDDGVQITAAPLWPLFRHKPWQKVLKDTWAKLEKGDYDWSHLAMSYWPARVREKCKTDKSLAIAHDLEALYVEPEAKQKKTRGKKNAGAIE